MIETFRVQSEILDSYRDDFSKYSPRVDKSCLDTVFLNVARRVGEQLKYTRLDEGHTGPTNRKAFELLAKAQVIHKIPSCDPSGLPLGATANPKRFKASLLDIGLLQRLAQVPVELESKQENLLAMYEAGWQNNLWPRNCWPGTVRSWTTGPEISAAAARKWTISLSAMA